MLTRITDFIWDCIFSLAVWSMSDEDRTKFNDISTKETSDEQEVETTIQS